MIAQVLKCQSTREKQCTFSCKILATAFVINLFPSKIIKTEFEPSIPTPLLTYRQTKRTWLHGKNIHDAVENNHYDTRCEKIKFYFFFICH